MSVPRDGELDVVGQIKHYFGCLIMKLNGYQLDARKTGIVNALEADVANCSHQTPGAGVVGIILPAQPHRPALKAVAAEIVCNTAE
jgi:hypothetical protein